MEKEQIEVMKSIENGGTVWSLTDAKAIRELQKAHPDWVDIISNLEELEEITGEKYDGAKKCPYFGAILTGEGKQALEDEKKPIIIAPHDSDEETKKKSKFVCKGEDDQGVIQQAMDSFNR